MKKNFNLLLLISLSLLLSFSSCEKDLYDDAIYQEKLKDFKLKSITFKEFINLAIIFSKYFVYLSYGKNRFSYVVRTRAIRFS